MFSCSIARMQSILSFSKFLLLVLLSSGFLLVWYGTNLKVSSWLPQETVVTNTITESSESVSDIQPSITVSKKTSSDLTRPKSVTVAKSIATTSVAKTVSTTSATKSKTTGISKSTSNFSSSESVWTRIGKEFKLDHKTQTSQVKAEIRKLLADQAKLYEILTAAGPYIQYIYEQTQARGLPGELALIPFIESEFNPNDHSHKGATGLWQLMKGTARILGVKVIGNYDGRRNVIASTRAALVYFVDLERLFKGNWYLAIAAYNCGQGRLMSAIRKAGSHSFWNLPVPQETKYYVPKLLAISAIVKNPEKYGITLPKVKNEPFFAELKVKNAVSLAKVAESANIDIKTLHTLNPDYKSGTPPKKDGAYSVLIPVEKVHLVKNQIPGVLSVS